MHFLVISLVAGAINYYFFRTASLAYPNLNVFWATSIVLLFTSPFISFYLEYKEKPRASLPFAWIGLTWFGLVGMADFLNLLADTLQFIQPDGFSDRIQFLATSSITGVLGCYGAISARSFRTVSFNIVDPKEDRLQRPVRIVQVTDLHLGGNSSLARAEKVVTKINELKPDIVVSTGDLFDGHLELMAPYIECLRRIEAPLGKFAVTGNHEVIAGLEHALSLTTLSGFTLLRNESADPAPGLRICGVEDPSSSLPPDEAKALLGGNGLNFTLLLKHRPELDPESAKRFDLQLSGHTHGGQIPPFHLLTFLAYRLGFGMKQVNDDQWIYVSRGTGTWGPQIRIFAPCELTVFDIAPNIGPK